MDENKTLTIRQLNNMIKSKETYLQVVNYKKYKIFPRNFTDKEKTTFSKKWNGDFAVNREKLLFYKPLNIYYILPEKREEFLHHLYNNNETPVLGGIQKFYKTISTKVFGITRDFLTNFLNKQSDKQLTTKYSHKKQKSYIQEVKQNARIFECDLIDMNSFNHRHYRYILTFIDVYSRKLFTAKLTMKDLIHVQNAVKEIIMSMPTNKRPKRIFSDSGGEFNFSVPFKTEYKFSHKKNKSYTPLPLVESVNGYLRQVIRQLLVRQKNKDWTVVLDKATYSLNNSFVEGINGVPERIFNDLDAKPGDNNNDNNVVINKPRFEVGDTVRILLSKIDTRIRERIKSNNNKQTSVLYSVYKFTIDRISKGGKYLLKNNQGDIVIKQRTQRPIWFSQQDLQKVDPSSHDILTIEEAEKINQF